MSGLSGFLRRRLALAPMCFISTGCRSKIRRLRSKKALASQEFRVRLFYSAKTGNRRPPEIRRQDNQRTDELTLLFVLEP
jgi:hypothetical protein